MFRSQLPRLYELRDSITNQFSPSAYFQEFEKNLGSAHVYEIYRRRERCLQSLDKEAWAFLKSEVATYLTHKDRKGRGWAQLFDILNQARAFEYLMSIGCTEVRFIPRALTARVRTPDLEAMLQGQRLLCEVKTLNISQMEVNVRAGLTVGTLSRRLGEGFLRKLDSSIDVAIKQMNAHDPKRVARHIVFLDPSFDDFLGEYKEDYFEQIDQYLFKFRDEPVEFVLYNDQTPFYKATSMSNASVVNEP